MTTEKKKHTSVRIYEEDKELLKDFGGVQKAMDALIKHLAMAERRGRLMQAIARIRGAKANEKE